jgi:hypothetical protein
LLFLAFLLLLSRYFGVVFKEGDFLFEFFDLTVKSDDLCIFAPECGSQFGEFFPDIILLMVWLEHRRAPFEGLLLNLVKNVVNLMHFEYNYLK